MVKSTGQKRAAKSAKRPAADTAAGAPAAKAGAAETSAAPASPGSKAAGAMLEAGIKALSLARQHSESGPGKMVASLIDPFGFRKLEDVFDLRVVAALERLGMPSIESIKALTDELGRLRARVAGLEAVIGAGPGADAGVAVSKPAHKPAHKPAPETAHQLAHELTAKPTRIGAGKKSRRS